MPSAILRWSAVRRFASTGILLLLLAAAGCGRPAMSESGGASPSANAAPREVSIAEVRLEHWPRLVRVQGSLLADERSVIGSRLAGRVEHVPVDLGSLVRQGDALVTLDRRELQLRIDQAEAQLRQAAAAIGLAPEDDESQLDLEQAPPVMLEQALVDEAQQALARGKQLLPKNALAPGAFERLTAQFQTAQARYRSALNSVGEQIALIGVRRAELALARQQWEDAEVTAPFAGTVEQRHVSPGEYVQLGQAVVTLVRADRLRFTAGVPERKASGVRKGQQVDIRLAANEEPIPAVVSRVSPMVAQASRSLWIEADVANPEFRLRAGQFAEADIVVDPLATTLTVPAPAVSEFAGVQKVWIVRDGKAQQQTVRTGRESVDRVEIVAGLSRGDFIVGRADHGYEGPVVAASLPSGGEEGSAEGN